MCRQYEHVIMKQSSSPCYKRLRRSYHHIALLHKSLARNADKSAVLQKMPNYVIKDVIEVLYNILEGNCKLNKTHLNKLRKHKSSLSKLYYDIKKHGGSKKKLTLYKQKGGFIGALIPIVSSVLSGLIGGSSN